MAHSRIKEPSQCHLTNLRPLDALSASNHGWIGEDGLTAESTCAPGSPLFVNHLHKQPLGVASCQQAW